MKKYRVRLEPDCNDYFITVEAENEEEAKEKAEENYGNGDIDMDDEGNYFDSSDMNTATAVEAMEIKDE